MIFKLPGLINLISTNPQQRCNYSQRPNAKDGTNQLRRNGIYIPSENIHITDFDKVQLAKFLKLDVIFDDSPIVIQNCLDNNIPCVMISTPVTPYNHHLRNKVEHYTSLYKALQQKVK